MGASTSLPLCNHTNWKKYVNIAINLPNTEQKDIINQTGCLVPCTYREYKVVQEPVRRPIQKRKKMFRFKIRMASTELRREKEAYVYPAISFIGTRRVIGIIPR